MSNASGRLVTALCKTLMEEFYTEAVSYSQRFQSSIYCRENPRNKQTNKKCQYILITQEGEHTVTTPALLTEQNSQALVHIFF